MALATQIESLLFVSIRPLSVKELMEKSESKKKEDVENALVDLIKKYNTEGSGITIQRIDDKVQMVTSKDTSEMISEHLKSEVSGELTPASLETLTVIAYRGPISKSELELIRGVNCSMIIRNLLIRGLIEERKGAKDLVPAYQITFEFLRYLGLADVKELPDYANLNSDENLKNLLKTSTTTESDDTNTELGLGAVEIPVIKAAADDYEGTEEQYPDEDSDSDDDEEEADKKDEDKDSLKEEGFDHIDEKELAVVVADEPSTELGAEDEDEFDEDDEDDDEDDEDEDEDDEDKV